MMVRRLERNGTFARSGMNRVAIHSAVFSRREEAQRPRPHAHWVRVLALGLTGGSLVQFLGCATGILPVILSLGESAILSLLLGGLVP